MTAILQQLLLCWDFILASHSGVTLSFCVFVVACTVKSYLRTMSELASFSSVVWGRLLASTCLILSASEKSCTSRRQNVLYCKSTLAMRCTRFTWNFSTWLILFMPGLSSWLHTISPAKNCLRSTATVLHTFLAKTANNCLLLTLHPLQ